MASADPGSQLDSFSQVAEAPENFDTESGSGGFRTRLRAIDLR
jgi:hypothetical protein